MQVLGAGLSRTGTISLRQAMDELGFGPAFHGGIDLVGDWDRIRGWIAAWRNIEDVDWEKLLGKYNSAFDVPVAFFWREIVRAYPDVKVILSVRSDENQWYNSMHETILRWAPKNPWIRRQVIWVLKRTSNWLPPYTAMAGEIMTEGFFHNRIDRESAIAAYRKHNADVIAEIPADRLLVWNPADGWVPLCKFLDVAVPAHPFPRLNERASMQAYIRESRKVAAVQIAKHTRAMLQGLRPRKASR